MYNQKRPLISVVIPVYNVEKYLRQCLDSVINQTYNNLEIICVNDCSPDKSAEILKEYALKDKRIKIINNESNLGLGLSRNQGIKIATGEYVHCLDSDDWLNPDAYEKLADKLNEIGDVDIIRFCYANYDEKTHKFREYYSLPDDVNNKLLNVFDYPWITKYWIPSAWAKLIRMEFIRENDLYYNDYRCLEDIEYSILSIAKAKKIYFSDILALNYRVDRKGSLLSNKCKFINNIIQDTKLANEITKDFPAEVRERILSYVYRHLIGLSLDAYYCRELSFEELKQIFRDNIIYDVLEKADLFGSLYNSQIYKKLMSYGSLHFGISYCGRAFIKKHFKGFTKVYFYIKRKITGNET